MEGVVERAQTLRSVKSDPRGFGHQFDVTRSLSTRKSAGMEFGLVTEQRRALAQPKQSEDRQRAPELHVLYEAEGGHQPMRVGDEIFEEQSPGFDDGAVAAETEFGINTARSPGVQLRVSGL